MSTAGSNRAKAIVSPRGQVLLCLMLVVGLLALTMRLRSVLRGGGLFAISDYDGAVYYTGADSLISGRVPYRDFLLLHPPGILLALAPFAALGRRLSDPNGFAVARVAFMLLGAVNAVLLTKIAARLGLVAAAAAGFFYAVWYPSMYAERTTLLEPLGTLALLVALLMLFKVRHVSPLGGLIAGLALGYGATVKIWGIVLVVIFVLWQLSTRRWRTAARIAGGAAIAMVVVCGPFFALAPKQMFRMVIQDQIGRPINDGSLLARLVSITSVGRHMTGASRAQLEAAVVILAFTALAAALLIWRDPSLRIVAILLVTTGVMLIQSPSYYRHYGEFVAAPLSLMVAATAHRLTQWSARRHWPARTLTATAIVMPLAFLANTNAATTFGHYFPWPDRATVAAIDGCVLSDDPGGLIELNGLSSDLRHGCHVWVDATGLTYDRDVLRTGAGHQVARVKNPLWQHDLMAYLSSGTAVIVLKKPAATLSAVNQRDLARRRVLARTPQYTIYGAG